MMNMKLLAVVTPPFIYHGCSTHKTFWEGKFTGQEKLTLGDFSAVTQKIMVFAMLVNTEILRLVISNSTWTSC